MPETLDICIIEDDDDARDSLTDILRLDRHRVKSFSRVDSAIGAGFARVDVVLMDRNLPDGVAEEMLPRLKELAPNTEFIIVTGYADLNAAIAALREGVSDYLIKPIDPDALRTVLSRLAKRRNAERELYRQRRFAEKLLDTAEAIIVVLDPDGIVLRANQYLLEITGYSMDEVVGRDWFDLFIPPQNRVAIRKIFEHTVKQIKTRGIVNPILTKDGRVCEIRWSNSNLRDADGGTVAVLAIGLDVTDYIQSQQRVLQNERLATIGQTMTGLAHESRNALQRMQNAVNLLQQELEGQTALLQDLAKIERAGHHIRNLMDEVRNYAAPINLTRENETLSKIWRRAWDSVAHLVAGRQVTLDDTNALSAEAETWKTIRADANRLEQVFRNLFENSFDAAKTESALKIEIECRQVATNVEVLFKDNGPGVPISHQEKLFEAFATSKSKGTGLGLAICRRIVEAHGGTITLCESDYGAIFKLVLPMEVAESAVSLFP